MIRRDMDEEVINQWREAVKSEVVDATMRSLYAAIEAATLERRPRCDQSGRCCHFDRFGHRLYSTGLEVASFLRKLNRPVSAHELARSEREGVCPFLVDGLCSVHDMRPMGCRIYFCDPTASDWQNDLYERSHHRIAALHEEQDIPYRYGEWGQMLSLCIGDGLNRPSSADNATRLPKLVHVRITC